MNESKQNTIEMTQEEYAQELKKRWDEFQIASEPLNEFLAKYSKDIMSVSASCFNNQWRIMNVYWIGENVRAKSL